MSKTGDIEIQIENLAEMRCAHCGVQIDIAAIEPFSGVECPSCGNQDTVPARFGEFLLLNLINIGGMGGVYRARDESLGRLVAIKVMLKTLGENAEFVENFKREAQAAARLNHPHVAQIYSYGQVYGQPYIVMELVSGQRFDRLIDSSRGGLDPALALRIAVDIAEGLQAAEEIGLVHGDIKPENILLDEKRKAKLVDFGIASFADQAAAEGVWGSPYYIAPERARGRKSDARSDIYSLGATLYHALAGRPPFEGKTSMDVVKARLTRDPPGLDRIRPELPKPLVETLMRMLAREPAQRHPTYASLLGDLRRNLQDVAAAGGALRAAVDGKRVMIKVKEPAVLAPVLGHNQRASFGDGAGRPFPRVEEQLRLLREHRQRKAKITKMVMSLIALAGLGVAGIIMAQAKKEKEEEARRSAYAIQQLMAQSADAHAAVGVAATNTRKRLTAFEPLLENANRILTQIETLAGAAAEGTDLLPAQQARGCVTAMEEHATVAREAESRLATILAAADALLERATQATTQSEVAQLESEIRGQQALVSEVDDHIQAELNTVRGLADSMAPMEQALRAAQAQHEQEEEQQRAEQARQEKIAEEIAAVRDEATRSNAAAMRFACQDAVRDAKAIGRILKTDEGQAALQDLLDRYDRLEGLKAFLVEELGKKPYAWGWVRRGAAREDILGADDKGIVLKGRTVPWADVSITRFLDIVEYCISNSSARRSTKGAQYLAAAIYVADRGNAGLASKYRDKALESAPTLAEAAGRLLPTQP